MQEGTAVPGRRVAVTGIGIVSALGTGLEAFHRSLAAATSGVRRLPEEVASGSGVQVGALIDWDPAAHFKGIAPGWFVTEMNQDYFASEAGRAYRAKMPPGRLGELPELLGPALLLVSGAGSYINGVVLPVDGGHAVALT